MKIYSREQFVQGLADIALSVMYLVRGISQWDGFAITMAVLWMILGIICITVSLDEERAAQARKNSESLRQTARTRFGKWSGIVLNAGWAAAIGGLLLLLPRPDLAGPATLIVLLGFLYEVLIAELLQSRR